MRMNAVRAALAAIACSSLAGVAAAEPMFLSRQYARCTTCHYSPTGGGLLTPYGRSLSNQVSSSGKTDPNTHEPGREESFLWGAFGHKETPLQLGIDLRPSRLHVAFPGGTTTRNFFMNADLIAAYRQGAFTAYGELGREPVGTGSRIHSYEYWASYQSSKGIGVRAGRFLPAYGIRFADHTSFNRRPLGFDTQDQIFGVELSHAGQKHLAQVAAGPGRADSIIDKDGTRGFTASARLQVDLGTRAVLVASGVRRNDSRLLPRQTSGALSLGLAPVRRVTIWTEGDVTTQKGRTGSKLYTFVNETSLEAYRGLWLKVSPQLQTEFGNSSGGTFRWAFEADLLPRTHWNVVISHYRDRNRISDIVTKTWLAQLHLYL